MRRFTIFGLCALLAAAAPALADVTVRYKVKGQAQPTVSLAVADDGRARFDSGDGVVLITRDNVGYFVTPDPRGPVVGRQDDGIALVTEFAGGMIAMMSAAQEQAQQAPPAPPPAAAQPPGTRVAPPAPPAPPAPAPSRGFAELRAMVLSPFEAEARGHETVSGREGTVYVIAPAAGGQGPTLEVVIASDADLEPVGREMRRLLGLTEGPATALLGETPDMIRELDGLLARGVPIRIGQHFTLDGVSAAPIPESAFALPGPVLTRAQLQERMALMPPAIAPEEADEVPTASEDD